MTELGIVDIREIIKTVDTVYSYDFSQYALTSLKQRLERMMIRNSISSAESLIQKIKTNPDFFDLFLYEISVPSTEMFRDPSLWRWLREELLPEATSKSAGKYKIWIPNCVSGGELYTIAILLKELNLTEKVEVIATTISNKSIEYVTKGQYDLKKIEVSSENYKRFYGTNEFNSYYSLDRYYAFRDTSLIKDVTLKKQNINFDDSPQNVKLILFRNNLIYYNPTLQEKILDIMYNSLSAVGYLIIGIREKIKGVGITKDFEVFNESEGIYRKKI